MIDGVFSLTTKVHILFSMWHSHSDASGAPALRSLRTYPHRIKGYEEAKAIKGVGEKTAKKVCLGDFLLLSLTIAGQ